MLWFQSTRCNLLLFGQIFSLQIWDNFVGTAKLNGHTFLHTRPQSEGYPMFRVRILVTT